MRAGDIVVQETETFRITRSAGEGGRFEFEITLAPGGQGPPTHTHEELETGRVISGEIIFWFDGVERRFKAGDEIVIPAGCAHTFKNASKTEPVVATGTHGGRFERLVDQLAAKGNEFTRMAMYATQVDTRASYMVNPFVRALLSTIALFGRLRGVKLAPATGAYGVDPRDPQPPDTSFRSGLGSNTPRSFAAASSRSASR